jgi:hypothetical protein
LTPSLLQDCTRETNEYILEMRLENAIQGPAIAAARHQRCTYALVCCITQRFL